MKIGINAGHTLNGKGSGAIGYLNESQETRKVTTELLKLLGNKGVDLTVDKSNNYLKDVVNKANKSDCDLFVSIHFNAGGGKGVEAYTYKGVKHSEAENVCENISKLGFKNRGVKDGSKLYVIKNTKMKAVLVEVCFIDSYSDVLKYKELGASKIAKTIYNSIV